MATPSDPLLPVSPGARPDLFGPPTLAPALSLRDPTFAPAAVGASNLALELHPSFLRVAAVETPLARLRLLEEFSLPHPSADELSLHDVRDLMNGYDVLTRNFWHSVRILVNNQSFTFVPDALFRKEYAVRYLELARGTSLAGEKVHYTRHPGWNVVTVFSVPIRLDDWLMSVYPFEKMLVFHQLDGLLALALSGKASGGKRLYLMLENGAVSLVHTDDGKLVYANRFAFRSSTDLAYYLLFALDELNLNPETLDVRTGGNLGADDELFRTLREHLPRVQLGGWPAPVAFDGPFADLEPHRFAGLTRIGTLP